MPTTPSRLPKHVAAVLIGAGFRQRESDDGTPYFVRPGRPERPELAAWRDEHGVLVLGTLPEATALDGRFGPVSVLPGTAGSMNPPVAVEVVRDIVLCPAAVAGAVRRVDAVVRAVRAGEGPPRQAVPTMEQRARARASARRQAGRIEAGDVQVMYVFGDDGRPSLAYTVGCGHLFGHPELVVLSLGQRAAHALLQELADRVRGGAVFGAGDVVVDAANFPLRLDAIAPAQAAAVLVAAARFDAARQRETAALQVVYPDAEGRFPDDPGYALPARAQDLDAAGGLTG